MLFASVFLVIISLVIIGLSFFQKDRVKDLEEEFEQLSMDVVQDKYKIERRMKVLEEELLVAPTPKIAPKNVKPSVEKSDKVSDEDIAISLFLKGYKAEQIAQFTSIPMEKVERAIMKAKMKGKQTS